MPRPVKPDEAKRDFTVEVRVTFAEKTQIKNTAKDRGLTTSDFLRGLAINAIPIRHVATPDREILLKILAENNKAGSNLNQIARALNRKVEDGLNLEATVKDIQYTIANYEKLQLQLMNILDHGY